MNASGWFLVRLEDIIAWMIECKGTEFAFDFDRNNSKYVSLNKIHEFTARTPDGMWLSKINVSIQRHIAEEFLELTSLGIEDRFSIEDENVQNLIKMVKI